MILRHLHVGRRVSSNITNSFEGHGVEDGPFSVAKGTPAAACDYFSPLVGPRQNASLDEAVKDARLGRMYAGAHGNGTTRARAAIGAIVADHVEMNWFAACGAVWCVA
ncbi:hypothetical protein M758_9G099300 [Ceratodon purpureus]|nr:hypothetical protein M758_9G099300 [Ceratodon purpureus]